MSDESRIADLITTIKRNERNATLDEVKDAVNKINRVGSTGNNDLLIRSVVVTVIEALKHERGSDE